MSDPLKIEGGARVDDGRAHYPGRCPITNRPYFCTIVDDGVEIPTYGGPYDSWTIPVRETDGGEPVLVTRRYDHDEGGWAEYESTGLYVIDNERWCALCEMEDAAEREGGA